MKLMLMEIGAPADVCPGCIQLKTLIKRLIRKKIIEVDEFVYRDATKEKDAVEIIFKHGGWYFSPEDPSQPTWFVPQLFIVNNDEIYFLFGRAIFILEEAKEIILERFEKFKKTNNNERAKLVETWLQEDICDPDTETEIWGEGTILPVLRPNLCKKVLEKINDDRIRRQAEIVKKLMSQKIQNK